MIPLQVSASHVACAKKKSSVSGTPVCMCVCLEGFYHNYILAFVKIVFLFSYIFYFLFFLYCTIPERNNLIHARFQHRLQVSVPET